MIKIKAWMIGLIIGILIIWFVPLIFTVVIGIGLFIGIILPQMQAYRKILIAILAGLVIGMIMAGIVGVII